MQARANADEAIAADVETFNARLGAAESSVTAETQARVNGDGALAADLETLNVTVGDHGASLTEQAAAIVDVEGRTEAFWQVTAVAGGRVKLRVYADANGGGGADLEGDLAVSGDLVVGGSLTSGKFALGATGQRAYFYDASGVNTGGSIWVNVMTVTMQPALGLPIEGLASVIFRDVTDANTKLNVRIVRDDGTPVHGGAGGVELNIQDEGTAYTVMWLDLVASGRVTSWTMQMRKAIEPGVQVQAYERSMRAEETTATNYQMADITIAGGEGPGAGDGGSGSDGWDNLP